MTKFPGFIFFSTDIHWTDSTSMSGRSCICMIISVVQSKVCDGKDEKGCFSHLELAEFLYTVHIAIFIE